MTRCQPKQQLNLSLPAKEAQNILKWGWALGLNDAKSKNGQFDHSWGLPTRPGRLKKGQKTLDWSTFESGKAFDHLRSFSCVDFRRKVAIAEINRSLLDKNFFKPRPSLIEYFLQTLNYRIEKTDSEGSLKQSKAHWELMVNGDIRLNYILWDTLLVFNLFQFFSKYTSYFSSFYLAQR